MFSWNEKYFKRICGLCVMLCIKRVDPYNTEKALKYVNNISITTKATMTEMTSTPTAITMDSTIDIENQTVESQSPTSKMQPQK